MNKLLLLTFVSFAILSAETLFEVKDASNNKVLDVSTDGLAVMNLGDTLMVISTSSIQANLSSSKGLSRTFSVTTASSKGTGNDLMRLTADSTRFWISDTGSGFGVTKSSVLKGVNPNLLEVSTSDTKMREGASGEKYTDFNPTNMFIGLYAGKLNSTGTDNVFIGNNSGASNESGGSNVFLGDQAGFNNISGYTNVFIGLEAGYSNRDKNANTYVGFRAGTSATGFGNTYVGHASGYFSTTGDQNSYYGIYSGTYSNGGYNNCYFGYNAASNNKDGHSNCVFGHYAGLGIEPTSTNYSDNCLYGDNTGQQLKTGSRNVMIGKDSGFKTSFGNNNVLMGYKSGYSMTTGSNNLFLGAFSGYSNATGIKNIFIGDSSGYNETGSNRFHLNNGSSTIPLLFGTFDSPRMVVVDGTSGDNPNSYSFYVNGTAGGDYSWNSLSDKRLKKNIKTVDEALNKVMKLRGVTYEWSDEKALEKGRRMGFLAQDSKDVIPETVDYNSEKDIYTMQYAPITALLVEALKEMKKGNDDLKNELLETKKELEKIKEYLKIK